MSCGALCVFHLSAIAIVLSNIIFGVSSGEPNVSHLSIVASVFCNVIFGEASHTVLPTVGSQSGKIVASSKT